MTLVGDKLADATRARLARINQERGGGRLNLYALFDRKQTLCLVIVANRAEQALDLAHEAGCRDWTLRDCVCRSIVRNIDDEEPHIVTAVKMNRM